MYKRYEIEPCPAGYFIIDTTIEQDGETPCNVDGATTLEEAKEKCARWNAEAHARLVEAAPQLLAVVKLTEDLFEAIEPVFALLDDAPGAVDFGQVRKTLKAVIAKAEGGE